MKFKTLVFSCFFVAMSFFVLADSPNPYVKDKDWKKVEPFLMPDDHPIKQQLDDFFSQSRAILSIKTMEKAGFENVFSQEHSHIVVTKHPEFPGYIFKIYLDAHRYYLNKPEFFFYILRAQGAQKIQKLLDEKDWNAYIKVPKKWIYALPIEPSPPEELIRKNFILVEEDMDIYNTSMTAKMWGSDYITPDLLYKFYFVLEELGLSDCSKPQNAPFSKDGRIALIDTQSHDVWPVTYYNLEPFLNSKMKSYWKKLTR
jgi:hypothetical protein